MKMFDDVSKRIGLEHLQKNSEGKVDFHTIEVPQTQDYSRICYFKFNVTVKILTEEIRALRKDRKLHMLSLPHHLSKTLYMGSFCLEDR